MMMIHYHESKVITGTILIFYVLLQHVAAETHTDGKNVVVGPGVIFERKHDAIFVNKNHQYHDHELHLNYTRVFNNTETWYNHLKKIAEEINNIKDKYNPYIPTPILLYRKTIPLLLSNAKLLLNSLNKFFDMFERPGDMLTRAEPYNQTGFVYDTITITDYMTYQSIGLVKFWTDFFPKMNITEQNVFAYKILEAASNINYYLTSRIDNLKRDINVMLTTHRLSPNVISKRNFTNFLNDNLPGNNEKVIRLTKDSVKYYYDTCVVVNVGYISHTLHVKLWIPTRALSSDTNESYYIYEIIPTPMLFSDGSGVIFQTQYKRLAVSSDERSFVEIDSFDDCVSTIFNRYYFCDKKRPTVRRGSGVPQNCLVAAFLRDRITLASCPTSFSFTQLAVPFEARFVFIQGGHQWFYSVSRTIHVRQLCHPKDGSVNGTVEEDTITLEPGIGTFSFKGGCAGISDDGNYEFQRSEGQHTSFVMKQYDISDTNAPPLPRAPTPFFTFVTVIILVSGSITVFGLTLIIVVQRINSKIKKVMRQRDRESINTAVNTHIPLPQSEPSPLPAITEPIYMEMTGFSIDASPPVPPPIHLRQTRQFCRDLPSPSHSHETI